MPGVLKCTMAKNLQPLIEQRELLTRQLQLHELKGESLQKKLDAAVAKLQDACQHDDVEETSSYHGGGYDYCAESFYTHTCRTCGKVLKQWSKMHYGIYG